MFASSYTSALRTHLKRHSDERPYECNQCDYASSHVFSLRTHLKTHSEEKSNKCNQCNFIAASHLKIHLKIHSGEKLNKCNQCDYASSWAGDLRTYEINTHEITQPFHTQLWINLTTHIRNELAIFLKYHLSVCVFGFS